MRSKFDHYIIWQRPHKWLLNWRNQAITLKTHIPESMSVMGMLQQFRLIHHAMVWQPTLV